jgi:hypothetical protein
MVVSTTSFSFKKLKSLADWKLLLFLVLFLNVKMAIKVPAIALIYLLQFDFKFGFSFKNSRLPLFYLLAIGIAVLNWVIARNYFNINYDIVLLTGIGFWVMCILAVHQVKLFVENNDTETIHRTIIAFFIINAVLSFCNIAAIILETGYINPYTYQGQYQKYFIGTGDYVRGLTFDTSTTNAVLNALGCIYFLNKKNAAMLLVCMAVMLLTASNFTNMMLLLCFAVLFIFKSTRDQKSLIALCIMFLVIFMVKVSPQNYMYAHEAVKNTVQPLVKTTTPQTIATLPVAPKVPIILKPVAGQHKSRHYVTTHAGNEAALVQTQVSINQKADTKMARLGIDSSALNVHTLVATLPVSPKSTPVQSADDSQAKRAIAKNYIDSVYTVTHLSVQRQVKTVVKPNPTPVIPATKEGRILIPKPDINSKPYQHIVDTNDYQKRLLGFIGTHKSSLPLSAQEKYKSKLPGKVISWQQTMHFLLQHPLKLITGDGMGNFSSKLAFRASGLGFAGGYPKKYVYLDPDFLSNHLDVYLNYFSKKTDLHSLINSPDSVYDQLLSEYGAIGVLAFFIWYIGYFLKHYKVLTYGLPILLIVTAMFFIEYWFEQLYILVFFELLLLLNIKENSPKILVKNEY